MIVLHEGSIHKERLSDTQGLVLCYLLIQYTVQNPGSDPLIRVQNPGGQIH